MQYVCSQLDIASQTCLQWVEYTPWYEVLAITPTQAVLLASACFAFLLVFGIFKQLAKGFSK